MPSKKCTDLRLPTSFKHKLRKSFCTFYLYFPHQVRRSEQTIKGLQDRLLAIWLLRNDSRQVVTHVHLVTKQCNFVWLERKVALASYCHGQAWGLWDGRWASPTTSKENGTVYLILCVADWKHPVALLQYVIVHRRPLLTLTSCLTTKVRTLNITTAKTLIWSVTKKQKLVFHMTCFGCKCNNMTTANYNSVTPLLPGFV